MHAAARRLGIDRLVGRLPRVVDGPARRHWWRWWQTVCPTDGADGRTDGGLCASAAAGGLLSPAPHRTRALLVRRSFDRLDRWLARGSGVQCRPTDRPAAHKQPAGPSRLDRRPSTFARCSTSLGPASTVAPCGRPHGTPVFLVAGNLTPWGTRHCELVRATCKGSVRISVLLLLRSIVLNIDTL